MRSNPNHVIALALYAALHVPFLHAQVVINEIHYNPDGQMEDTEFVELWNSGDRAIDLGNWSMSAGIAYTFPAAAFIQAGGFVVIARSPHAFAVTYPGVRHVYGPFATDNRLSNNGERLALSDASGVVVRELTYGASAPWPVEADGGGASLELRHPAFDPERPGSWAASTIARGTPGATNSCFTPDALLFRTSRTPESPASGSNVLLSTRFLLGVPSSVTVACSSGTEWSEQPAARSADGIWTAELPARPDGSWVSYFVYAQATNGVMYGQPPVETQMYRVTDQPITAGELQINEIMYHSAPDAHFTPYEYIELVNAGARTVDIGGCVFEDLRLPTNELLLAPGRYAVLSDEPGVMDAVYGPIDRLIPLGMGLSDDGERLVLRSPNEVRLSEVEYAGSNGWPASPGGMGPSLELRSPYLDMAVTTSWAASAGYGTPGGPNSAAMQDVAHTLFNVRVTPPSPVEGEPFIISAHARASTNITAVIIEYRTNASDVLTVEMTDGDTPDDGVYEAVIPAMPHPAYIWYRFMLMLEDGSSYPYAGASGDPAPPLTVRLSGSGLETTVDAQDAWQVATTTGAATSSRLYMYLEGAGAALVDDVSILEIGGSGFEHISNGAFAVNDATWTKAGNHSGSVREPLLGHASPGCERIVSTGVGGSAGDSVNCRTAGSLLTDGREYQLRFAYRRAEDAWFLCHYGRRDYSAVRINEIMASNNSTYPDETGAFSDWIELHNTGDTPVPLGGLFLTDNLDNPTKWQIPAAAALAPHGYAVFRADGTGRGLHASFGLSRDGEEAGLFSPEGELIDAVAFGAQFGDVSYGRQPDGTGVWAFFAAATPNAPNGGETFASVAFAPMPEAAPASGFHGGTQSVVLAADAPGAAIRFTLDGTLPSPDSALYDGPIIIASTTVVRARAYVPGMMPSAAATFTYFIGHTGPLAVVSLSTTPAFFFDEITGMYVNDIKDVEIPVHISMHEPDGALAFSIDAGTQLAGYNIFRFAQNPLNIFARGRYGASLIEYPLFPDLAVDAFKRIVLRNSGDDCPYTMFRDPMMQRLVRGEMPNAQQAYRPCALYLNGQYWGIHNIRERFDSQYFIGHFGLHPGQYEYIAFDMYLQKPVASEGSTAHYDALLDYITTHDMSLSDTFAHVASQMDIASFADNRILQAYTANTSWQHNQEWWRPLAAGGKWQWVVVDTDRGFHTSNLSLNMVSSIINADPVLRALLNNAEFRREFAARFAARLSATFQPGRVIGIIDQMRAGIAQEMPRHIARWGALDGIESMDEWEGNVEDLRIFARSRPAYVRDHLRQQFGLGAGVALTLRVREPGAGRIAVNDVPQHGDLCDGAYFQGMPLRVEATPAIGHRFVRWEESPGGGTATLVSRGAQWRYLDTGADMGAEWHAPSFDDATWQEGPAQFGYGDGDEATVVSYGPESTNRYVTTYFRTAFSVADPGRFLSLQLALLRDDGAVVYLNGTEIERSNMPASSDYLTLAQSAVSGGGETTFYYRAVSPALLVAGVNILAAEVHQSSRSSSDVSYDAELTGVMGGGETGVVIATTPVIAYTVNEPAVLTAVFEPGGERLAPSVITGLMQLTGTGEPYYAQGDIIVPSNATLVIGPGVEVRMPQAASIHVYGELHIMGSTNSPVRIAPNNAVASAWGAICFDHAQGTSTLSNVRLEGATHSDRQATRIGAVSSHHSCLVLDGVVIEAEFPVHAEHGYTIVRNCRLHSKATCDLVHFIGGSGRVEGCDLRGSTAPDTDAIDYDGVANGEITSNYIHDIAGLNCDGIDLGEGSSNITLVGNIIRAISDKGISVGQASTAVALKNLITGCGLGLGVKDKGSFVLIDRCTLHGNIIGVACFEKSAGDGGGRATVINTIVSRSWALALVTDAFSRVEAAYSLSDIDVLDGEGTLLADPLFVNAATGDFNLRLESPCINAGWTNSPPDPDGTRADLGAFPYTLPEPAAALVLAGIALVLRRGTRRE